MGSTEVGWWASRGGGWEKRRLVGGRAEEADGTDGGWRAGEPGRRMGKTEVGWWTSRDGGREAPGLGFGHILPGSPWPGFLAIFCRDANGVVQFQPWATPKVQLNQQTGALKARLIRLHPIPNITLWHGIDETRFQRSGFRFRVTLGPCGSPTRQPPRPLPPPRRLELKCAFGAPDAISQMQSPA